MKRRSIREGMLFAVPLKSGGYGLCLVARHSRSGVTVGYFYGPRTVEQPDIPESLDPQEAVLVQRFGDIPIVDDIWPCLGVAPFWDRDKWAGATFFRGDRHRGTGFLVYYDDSDPNEAIREVPVRDSGPVNLPADGLAGYIIVRNKFEEMLTL